MKTRNIITLTLCLNGSIMHAGLDLCCPLFVGLGPICIKEGFHLFNKANNVEKAREEYHQMQHEASPTEESIENAPANQRMPYGSWFPPTYEATRRKQGCAWIAVGTAMSMSALYTASKVGYQIYSADKQE